MAGNTAGAGHPACLLPPPATSGAPPGPGAAQMVYTPWSGKAPGLGSKSRLPWSGYFKHNIRRRR